MIICKYLSLSHKLDYESRGLKEYLSSCFTVSIIYASFHFEAEKHFDAGGRITQRPLNKQVLSIILFYILYDDLCFIH